MVRLGGETLSFEKNMYFCFLKMHIDAQIFKNSHPTRTCSAIAFFMRLAKENRVAHAAPIF